MKLSMKPTMKLGSFATLAILLAPPAPAMAQPEVKPPAPPPLSGPEVAEQRIEGVESGFSSMTAPGRMARRVPMPVFRRALAELAGDSAPDGARLTEQQVQRLRAVQREHQRAQRAFRRQHAGEFRELREAMGPALADRLDLRVDRPRPERRRASRSDRRPDGAPERRRRDRVEGDAMGGEPMRRKAGADRAPGMNPDQPDQPDRSDRAGARDTLTEGQRAAIGRLRELRAKAPGPEALQTRIWAELTEPQQAHVQSRIEAHRAEMSERRAAAYVERMMARRAEAGEAGDRPARPRAAAVAELAPELRKTLESLPEPLRQRIAQLPLQRLERLLERLSRLTPDERAQALRRLARDRRSDRPRAAEGAADRPRRKPPPPVEAVDIPRPKDTDG